MCNKSPDKLRPFDLWEQLDFEFATGDEDFDAYLKWLQIDQGITDTREFYRHAIAYLEGGYDDEEYEKEDATSTETS